MREPPTKTCVLHCHSNTDQASIYPYKQLYMEYNEYLQSSWVEEDRMMSNGWMIHAKVIYSCKYRHILILRYVFSRLCDIQNINTLTLECIYGTFPECLLRGESLFVIVVFPKGVCQTVNFPACTLWEQRRPRQCTGPWEGQEVAENGALCVPVALCPGRSEPRDGARWETPGGSIPWPPWQRLHCFLLQTSLIFKHWSVFILLFFFWLHLTENVIVNSPKLLHTFHICIRPEQRRRCI